MGIRVWKYLSDKVIPPYKPSDLGKAITDSMIDFPDDWIVEDCTVKHAPSGIQIWAANGSAERRIWRAPEEIDTCAVNKHLSYGDRVAINAVIRKLRKRAAAPDATAEVISLLSKQA